MNINTSCKFNFVLLILLAWQTGMAQHKNFLATQGTSFFGKIKYDSKVALGGLKEVFISPLTWQQNDLLRAGIVGVGTGLLYTVDEEISSFFQHQKQDVPQILLAIGKAGSPEAVFALNGTIYVGGLLFKNEKIRHTGLLLVTSATASGFILTMSKVLVGRARPSTGKTKGSFSPFSLSKDSYRSFPSGHTLFAFSTAYAIGKQIKNPFLKAGVYSLGLIGPASRLWEGEHWLTDVAVSLALGVAVVEAVEQYLQNQKKLSSLTHKKISWNLNIGPTAIKLTGTF